MIPVYIHSRKLMSYLLGKGFCQIDMYQAYIENQDKTIYVFIDSPQIQRAIKQYKNS